MSIAVTDRSSSAAWPAYCGSNRSSHESGGSVITSALYMMPAVPASTGTRYTSPSTRTPGSSFMPGQISSQYVRRETSRGWYRPFCTMSRVDSSTQLLITSASKPARIRATAASLDPKPAVSSSMFGYVS